MKIKIKIGVIIFCILAILGITLQPKEVSKPLAISTSIYKLNDLVVSLQPNIVEAEDRTEELKSLQQQLNKINNQSYSESISSIIEDTLYAVDTVEYKNGAGDEYETIGTIEEKTKVQVTGITQNNWYQCNIDNQIVYIYSDYLEEKKIEITATGSKAEYQKYAYSLFEDFGWDDSEFDPLVKLWNRESGWSPSAHNSSSGAHGIPQSLPASKMASEGDDYYTNGYTQIRWGLKYIANRYGSPSNAWAHSERTGWY